MGFLFDIVFYPIAFLIIGLFLFYEPVATSIVLGVFLVIVIVGAVLLYKYRQKHGHKQTYRRNQENNAMFWIICVLTLPIAILRELLKNTK